MIAVDTPNTDVSAPANLEAEHALLGVLLYENDALERAIP